MTCHRAVDSGGHLIILSPLPHGPMPISMLIPSLLSPSHSLGMPAGANPCTTHC
jgi:hypothetical protein